MNFKILLFLFFISFSAGAKTLEEVYKDLSSLPMQSRLGKSTASFVGTPTGLNPLGEGTSPDPNPTFSLSKFDCTTYVETNLALALAQNQQEVPLLLNKIRYQGDTVDYFQRNHFMVSDWIPANSKKGFVTEITTQLSTDKTAYRVEKKVLNKTSWFFHRVIDLLDQQKKSPDEILGKLAQVPQLPIQEEKTTYLLASYFRANVALMVQALPEISIVMFIRNIPSTPTLVNHMGFVIKKNGKLYLNHAPQAKPWKVQEVLLEDYFKDMDTHRAPVEGLLFLKAGK